MAQTKTRQRIKIRELIKTAGPKHAISITQFEDKKLLDAIFATAAEFKAMPAERYPKLLRDKIVATLFFEPSTRTRLSFETAVQRLGGQIISVENAGESSSKVKGESLEDTIRTLNGYADAIVIRHPEVGSAQTAADVATVPIINGGDGAGDHPTQALLDLFTIQEAKGKIDELTIGLAGDALNSRSFHSLLELLSLYDVKVYCMAPKVLQLPKDYQAELRKRGLNFELRENWNDVIGGLDVLYTNRIQQERFASPAEYEKVKGSFVLTKKDLVKAKKDTIIMNPLPRINEITIEIDDDPRAIYFEQARNGLFVRMALLQYIFE